ncbi:Lysophospholipase L1 [Butyrivibrio fibrisolvens DSM 3071]|uniref:Lysophospholipase L1 n=2 Tax=Butyrivibrio fibrisolvens TaxID=831 RepID=A0A1M6ANV0_BUTFI|nr:Lysophospholipase L1 [Butyrivibrio fibrisolvens DSM 3071]
MRAAGNPVFSAPFYENGDEIIMIDFDKAKAIANHGDTTRLFKLFSKLEEGKPVTLCFLGGSITQGSLSSKPTTCYAYKVYEWFKETFKNDDITYVNAGIGGTTSAFGAARCDRDVLSHNPDFVFVEFSVNDECDDYFYESYEGLIRKLLYSRNLPAVAALFNFFYQDGKTSERIHSKVARYYGIPAASMHGAIYEDILSGKIEDISTLSPDGLHPNDTGHDLLSRVVANLLGSIYEEYKKDKETSSIGSTIPNEIKAPLTVNSFEGATRLDNRNFTPDLQGFSVDTAPQKDVTDCFKNGWLGARLHDKIVFEFDQENECTGIAVQYDKTMKRPAPVVSVMVDDNSSEKILIDAAFDETWGDLLDIRQIFLHEKKGPHRLEIEVIDDKDGKAVPFNLVSVIITR